MSGKIKLKMWRRVAVGVLCVLLGLPIVSVAAEQPSESEGSSEQAYKLPSVVVTADKRVSDLQKIPASVTVFSQQDLEDRNIKTVREVLARVPNLAPTSDLQGGVRMSYRGAMTSVGTETSPFVMYVDGVPVDAFSALDASLLNIERVEVLRGAQSALYGKNAFAGVINIISKKPDDNFTGVAFVDGGTEYSYQFGSTVSGPVVKDRLFFSLSAGYENRDGYLDFEGSNESNTKNNKRLKGQLRFLATDDSEINLHVGYTELRDGPAAFLIPADDPASSDTKAKTSDFRDTDIFSAALHGAVDFADVELKSITTYRYDKMKASVDTGPVFAPGLSIYSTYKESSYEVTQELRLQSPEVKAGDIDWLVGVYGGYRDFDRTEFAIPAMKSNSPFKLETFDFAPFGQAVVPLFVDELKLTAGLRWQYVNRKASIKYINMGTLAYQVEPDETWTELLPKLVLSYDITDKHMVYAGVNKSFMPGGFNAQQRSTTTPYLYKPQSAWNYEAGVKTSWLDNRLNANLALFYAQYEDMQVMYWNITGYPVATNAGKATSYGAELELDAQLLPGLRGSAALGYTHAEFDEYSVAGQDNGGNKVPLTPDYTANLALLYRHDSGFMGQAEMQYASKIYWKADNVDSRDAVTTVNMKVGYEGESFDTYLYVTNLFDERYLDFYEPSVPALGYESYGLAVRPREFGLRVVYHW